jgi:ABC-2 type transport system permease protein
VSATLLIARREFSAYLRTWLGYLVAAGVLAVWGLAFNAGVLGRGPFKSADVLGTFFWWTSGLTMVVALLLSMRLLAEERGQGTINLLYSSPVRDGEIVVGKFLACFGFVALFILATLYMPALIFVNGKVSFGHIAAGYFGLFLVGAATVAIGAFASALTKSQVVAIILGGCFTLVLVLTWVLARITERPLTDVFNSMALWNEHYPAFQHGIVHVRDVVYYLAVTYVALFAATRVLEARRWR